MWIGNSPKWKYYLLGVIFLPLCDGWILCLYQIKLICSMISKIIIYMQTIGFEVQLQFLRLFMMMLVHKGEILRTGSQICKLVYQDPVPCLMIPSELRSILTMVLYPMHMNTKKWHRNGLRTPRYGWYSSRIEPMIF